MSKVAKKCWRDAATLIITGKRSPEKCISSVVSSSVEKNHSEHSRPSKVAGDASSSLTKSSDFDVLMLKRSSSSRFMPDAYVFPGGVIDSSDHSAEWAAIFTSAGFKEDEWKSVARIPGQRPGLFDNYKSTIIGPDVGFRICALRETFEESGLLLVKPNKGMQFAGLNHAENVAWRKKVHGNACMFLEMCRKLLVVPDIWSLREWSNWLTPAAMRLRYDTIFYLCGINHQPHIEQDHKETTHAQWSQPTTMLKNHAAEKLWIAPPQSLELMRLARYARMDDLVKFSEDREPRGTERWLPFRYRCRDAMVSVLPGDDMYPFDPECKGADHAFEASSNMALVEFNKNLSNFNRIEMRSKNNYNLVSTCGRLGHSPINFNEDYQFIANISDSKL